MTVQTSNSNSTRPTQRSTQAQAGAATIDPVRIIRQHLSMLIAGGVLGLVVGVGVFLVWRQYYPSYSAQATFELVGMLDDAGDPLASEDRNEDTVQRIAATEAAKAILESNLVAVLALPDVRGMAWMESFEDEQGRPNLDEALLRLTDEISAGYRRRTQYFDVSWAAKKAEDVPVLLNAVADEYMESRFRQRRRQQLSAKQPFVDNLDEIGDEIAILENDVRDFIGEKKMLSLEQTTTAVQKDLEDRELEKNEVLSDIERTSGLMSQLDAKLSGAAEPTQDDIREAESDQVVIRALSEVQTLRGLVSEHRQSFGPEHTQYRQSQRALDARIREKDRKVEEVVLRNLQGQRKMVGDSFERLLAVEEALDKEILIKSAELNDFVAAQAELEQMRESIDRKELRRDRMLDQIDQIDAMFLRKDADEVRRVAEVTIPREPNSPKWFVVIPGTAILLLGLLVSVIFLRETLDKRIRSTTDLTSLPGTRLLGVIPDLKDDPTDASRAETVVRDFPGSVLSESHRQFAASLRRAREDANASSVLFVGGMPGAGTTSVATNLASIAAAAGRKVAIVDGNLRRPRIAEVFGLDDTEPGLGDVIVGDSRLADVVHKTQEGIRVVTAGTVANRFVERLDADSLRTVITELREHVDVVLVDGPPVVVASEAMGMADQVDATVLVVRAYSEQRGLVARLMRQLQEQPSSFLGVVLNRPRNTAGGYFKRNYEAIAQYSAGRDAD